MMNHSENSVRMWTTNHSVVVVVVVVSFASILLRQMKGKNIYIRTQQVHQFVQVQLCVHCTLKEIKRRVNWAERNGTHTVASFHMTWPLTNHSFHRQSTMFNLLDDTSNLFQFSLLLCVFDSSIHSFIQSFFVYLTTCLPFQLNVGMFHTEAYTIHTQSFVGILFSNRYTTQ